MSAAARIVAECSELGVRIEVRADGLLVKPASVLPPELKARIRAAKPELLALLTAQAPKAESDADGDTDSHGRPLYGCWNCGCRDYALDLAGHGWACVQDHPIEAYREHVARWKAPYPSRRRGGT